MTRRTKLEKRMPSADTCHKITIYDSNCEPLCDLLLYGLSDNDIYLVPNPYVSAALNRRGFKPGEINVSPFLMERIR